MVHGRCLVGSRPRSAAFPADPEIETRLSADGQAVAYWRATASGWVLGLALTWDGDRFHEYLYAGAKSPAGTPGELTSSWGDSFDTPPDWG